MYALELSESDRRAFDCVGDRYNAWRVSDILCSHLPDDADWSDLGPIIFMLPEDVTWQIRELAEEEDFLWPCFSTELKGRLNQFLDQAV